MSRIDQFNASSSEGVLSQMPSKINGEEFNLLHGATPVALPASLGTSQGNSNPDYQGEAGQIQKQVQSNIPVTPHGTLVRNPNIVSLEPLNTEIFRTSIFNAETISGTTLLASGSFANIAIATNSFSGTFSQPLSVTNPSGTVSNIVVLNVYSGTTTATALFSGSAVQTSGAGWSQSGSNIVWTNGIYATFSGAASAAAGRTIPISGQSYYFDATYIVTMPQVTTAGGVQDGLFGSLSVGAAQQDAWVGNNVFGKSTFGDPEVQITNFSGTRDSLSFPTNQNIKASDLIPNVGSRFFRA